MTSMWWQLFTASFQYDFNCLPSYFQSFFLWNFNLGGEKCIKLHSILWHLMIVRTALRYFWKKSDYLCKKCYQEWHVLSYLSIYISHLRFNGPRNWPVCLFVLCTLKDKIPENSAMIELICTTLSMGLRSCLISNLPRSLQESLHVVELYAYKWRLHYNPNKSISIVFYCLLFVS